MLLEIPLKFWQMCKNSLAIISGTPQFFIRHVNNAGGRWNCLCTLTSRLTGRQGRCASSLLIIISIILSATHLLVLVVVPGVGVGVVVLIVLLIVPVVVGQEACNQHSLLSLP